MNNRHDVSILCFQTINFSCISNTSLGTLEKIQWERTWPLLQDVVGTPWAHITSKNQNFFWRVRYFLAMDSVFSEVCRNPAVYSPSPFTCIFVNTRATKLRSFHTKSKEWSMLISHTIANCAPISPAQTSDPPCSQCYGEIGCLRPWAQMTKFPRSQRWSNKGINHLQILPYWH